MTVVYVDKCKSGSKCVLFHLFQFQKSPFQLFLETYLFVIKVVEADPLFFMVIWLCNHDGKLWIHRKGAGKYV